MTKNKLIVGVILLIIALLLVYWFRQSQIAERRHHIFCEVLIPGASKEAAIATLKELGDIEYSESSQGEDRIFLALKYKDGGIAGNNGIVLMFEDQKYVSAFMMVGLDKRVFFCEP
jgi:hypothetical protein